MVVRRRRRVVLRIVLRRRERGVVVDDIVDDIVDDMWFDGEEVWCGWCGDVIWAAAEKRGGIIS
jgi:hypothetical protein